MSKGHKKHDHCHTHTWVWCSHCQVYYCNVDGCDEERRTYTYPWQPYRPWTPYQSWVSPYNPWIQPWTWGNNTSGTYVSDAGCSH